MFITILFFHSFFEEYFNSLNVRLVIYKSPRLHIGGCQKLLMTHAHFYLLDLVLYTVHSIPLLLIFKRTAIY